ncbi:MAG TPA: LLM class F420-dependent oxidoreductase [Anaerolineales bacterium]|nr:LLM class F420-dependent oxidoreductase [Anaerolineales bacterium]
MQVAIMIEGQEGLTWERWQRLVKAVEDFGFDGLHRSDHFTNAGNSDQDSLPLWPSLTWLADHSQRITFGPLVTPTSVRHPVHTARMGAAVDNLSGGRLILGLGAGWNEREHHNFGFPLLDLPERFARFEESLEVITRLLRSDEPVSFSGEYYQLHDAILLPRPRRAGSPSILIGGNGPKYTLPLAARYADEWNAVFIPAGRVAELNHMLDELLTEQGRTPESVYRSLMTTAVFGRDAAETEEKARRFSDGKLDAAAARSKGMVTGDGDEFVYQLGLLAEAGVQRVMLQWLDQEDLAGLEHMAQAVLPQVR